MSEFKPDKSKMKRNNEILVTQSLFIDYQYDPELAVYTWGDEDKEYKGVLYPSLKRLFLEMEDPTEYSFATKYLVNWKHWQRMNNSNKVLRGHFDEWREELEIKIRSQAVLSIIDQSVSESGGFQASKWLADRGWDKRGPGRPSKAERDKENAVQKRIKDDFDETTARMQGLN